MSESACLSVCPSVCLPACLFVLIYLCVSIYVSIDFYSFLSICFYPSVPIHLCILPGRAPADARHAQNEQKQSLTLRGGHPQGGSSGHARPTT